MALDAGYGIGRIKAGLTRPIRGIVDTPIYALAIFLFCVSTEVAAVESNKTMFVIEAQPAILSLAEYAQQADVQVGYSFDVVENVQTNAVMGEYEADQALDLLLKNTGLTVEHGERGLVIRRTRERRSGSIMQEPRPATATTNSLQQTRPASQSPVASAGSRSSRNLRDNSLEPALVEEIVVTGSNIRGVEAVGVDVITLDRSYIELSGIATTTELIQTVPQNVGIANEAVETGGITTGAGRNRGFAAGVSLRGLGTDSTLVLVNGRRAASGGSAGNFVDLNSIPTSAIERIEILADGASAIYGSDAVGGVVNVILRSDYEGAETSVRYAPGTSDIDEIQVSQVFGKTWNTGNVLFGLEYYDRSELKSADRFYSRDSDLTPLGGEDESSFGSNPGNIDRFIAPDGSITSGSWAIPEGQDGTALTPDDLLVGVTNLQNTREGSDLLPQQTRRSAFVTARHSVSKSVELFGELRISTREFETRNRLSEVLTLTVPSTNPFFVDAVGGSESLRMRYSSVADYGPSRSKGDVETVGGVLGATFLFGESWALDIHGSNGTEDTFSRTDRRMNTALLAEALADPDPATAFNPFGDGSFTNPATLAAVEGYGDESYESELTTVDARLDGDLFDMPGGTAKLAVGAQYRDQSLAGDLVFFLRTLTPVPGSSTSVYQLDRQITAAFAELHLPIVSSQNSRPGIESLTLSIAGRYEDYTDFGDTFNPKLGVSWSPTKSLTFRGTVGTSFRAPLLTELNTTGNTIRLFNMADDASPTGRTLSLLSLGNSPDLRPQEGTSWTAGIDMTPISLPGLSFGLTYFSTEVDDLIGRAATGVTTILLDPVTNAPLITRCPEIVPGSFGCDAATVNVLMNDPQFISTPVPPDQVGAIVDGRIRNVATATISGLDINATYSFNTDVGDFNLSLYASHVIEYKTQLLNAPPIDRVDTVANPNSLTLRSSFGWSSGGFNAAVIARHIGDYNDNLGSAACAENPCPVASWTTWDLQVGYEFGERAGFLNDARLSLSVRNVLDKDPPFVFNSFSAVGFDAINADPMGRLAALQLIKSW